MFLKSLSLKGFKSFADPAVLEFEPGVTVVVGPNGSGKSNVVDAVAWVLGAQGPRTVRSAKMEDVIFMGTSNRPALGRAEVSLTIDNSSGKLSADLAEVTITRTLFRSGDSEYSMYQPVHETQHYSSEGSFKPESLTKEDTLPVHLVYIAYHIGRYISLPLVGPELQALRSHTSRCAISCSRRATFKGGCRKKHAA